MSGIKKMTSCQTCILYQFCTHDRTGICEAENFEDVIPDKCKFCEKRWVCPMEKGGECVKEKEAESIAKRSTIKPE